MESDLFGGSLGKKNTVSKSPKPVKAASEQKKISADSKLPPATSSTTESAKSKMASASSSSSTKSISVLGSHLFTDTFSSVTVKWQLFKSDNLKRSCASISASESRPLSWMTNCWWSIFMGLLISPLSLHLIWENFYWFSQSNVHVHKRITTTCRPTTLKSVYIFSLLFSIHFLRCWQGEIVF